VLLLALLLLQVLVKSTGERCYFPNTRLITLPVVNLTRSCARSEKVVISLNVGQASNAAREALLVSRPLYSLGFAAVDLDSTVANNVLLTGSAVACSSRMSQHTHRPACI
jgi:hypothetical protein